MGFFDVLGSVCGFLGNAYSSQMDEYKKKAAKEVLAADKRISSYESRSNLTAEQKEKLAKAREINNRQKDTLGL
jgi:uncharacterized protein YaiL (DUF2058 family)